MISFDLNRKVTDDDRNGDGIPDGAEVTLAREIMGDDGTRQKMTAKWTKGQNAGAIPVAPPADAPPKGTFPSAQRQFEGRVARAADLYGIRRTDTDVNPVDIMARKSHLETQAASNTNSPGQRAEARQRLAQIIAEEQAAASRTNTLAIADKAMQGKQAEAQGRLDVAAIMGQSRVDAASETGASREAVAQQQAAQREKEFAEKMKLERDKLSSLESREQARREMWANRDANRAALRQAKTREDKQRRAEEYLDKSFGTTIDKGGNTKPYSLRTYIVNTYDQATGKPTEGAAIDPVMEDALNFLNQEWQTAFGKPYLGGETKSNSKNPFQRPRPDAVLSPSKGWVILKENGNKSNPSDWIPVP